MTRSITAMGTAALCAIVLATVQIGASAQSQTAAKATAKPAAAAPAKPVPAKPAVTSANARSVTLSGCLEADGRKFVLTAPEGAQAPKGRSWKTGFVTKKPKNVELTAASSVKLGDHLGHKVSVVGVRNGADTHLEARSIRQLAASCS